MSKLEYMIGGNTIVDVPIIVAFEDKEILSAATSPRNQIGLQCYLYDDRKHVAVVRDDRVFPTGDRGVAERYQFQRKQDRQSILDRQSNRTLVELVRHAGRPTYQVTLNLELPDGSMVRATPDKLESAWVTFSGNQVNGYKGFKCVFAIRCTKAMCPALVFVPGDSES